MRIASLPVGRRSAHSVNLIIRRIVAHAKGKRRTEDKTETKEGPENGEGL
jgi:hypothetical protein